MKKLKRGKKNVCDCEHNWWHILSGKLAAIAFILFLITVWPAAMGLVNKIHWGWFLGAGIILCALAVIGMKNCCGKK